MVQSFWLTEEWKKFKKYTRWLENKYKTMRMSEIQENIDKWTIEWYRKKYDKAPPSWLVKDGHN